MSNLEELNKLTDNLFKNVELLKENDALTDPNTVNLISLNLAIISTYLASIAKSLAVIADKMSEEK